MKKNIAKISGAGQNKWKHIFDFARFLFTPPGLRLAQKTVRKYLQQKKIIKSDGITYAQWLARYRSDAQLKASFNPGSLQMKPNISIIITDSDGNTGSPLQAIESILAQFYPHWKLYMPALLHDPAITHDPRIKLIPCNDTNIANILNTLAAAATGEYLLFMYTSDTLTADCLSKVVKYLNEHPQTDLLYTGEDMMNSDGSYASPYFKPSWSPDSLLSRNYIGHTVIIKNALFRKINGFRTGYDACCYYGLLLRATELNPNIGHISLPLYHCKATDLTPGYDSCSRNVLQDALQRRNLPATITPVQERAGCYHIHYEVTKPGKVSIIIPTRDGTALLKTAVDSILQKTSYPDYEIVVLNNNSVSADFFALVKEYEQKYPGIFRCIEAAFPFNFARLMNIGVATATGDYILMCNNDVEVINDNWLTDMVSYAQLQHTGAVGVRLLYPDGTIQHAGIALGMGEASGHVFAGCPENADGYFHSLQTATNYTAVTAACLMCRRSLYNEVGGMDESLAVEYNDVDLCLKFLQAGYYNVYLPFVTLFHYESATRGHPFRSYKSWQQHDKELGIFRKKWQPLIDNDPFLSRYALAFDR